MTAGAPSPRVPQGGIRHDRGTGLGVYLVGGWLERRGRSRGADRVNARGCGDEAGMTNCWGRAMPFYDYLLTNTGLDSHGLFFFMDMNLERELATVVDGI